MEPERIRDTLYNYIRDACEVPEDDTEYTHDVNLFDYGYVDSFGATDILAFIESTYGIEVTQKDLLLYPMSSISEITEYIVKKVNG
ncbi:MAG TPA: acyl carrier protein [Clostridia bacterium]|nr:acyl carrier protein [Clostridia bacterium]